MTAEYEVVAGPGGLRDAYALTVLDANVVKDISLLYRVGLNLVSDGHTADRLRGILRRRDSFGILFAGSGALELAQPLTDRFDTHRFRSLLVSAESVGQLTPGERLIAFKTGAPVCEIRPDFHPPSDEGEEMLSRLVPEYLGDAAVLTKAWLLRDEDADWDSALRALTLFCNDEIRYAPGIAIAVAIAFLAGTGDVVSRSTGVLKYSAPVNNDERKSRVWNAVGDTQVLNSMRRVPFLYPSIGRATLTSTCVLTGDRGLATFSRDIGYGVNATLPGASQGSSIRMDLRAFPIERRSAVVEAYRSMNRAQATRRNTPRAISEDTKFSLIATAQFLDGHDGSKWSELAGNLNSSPDSWWNAPSPSRRIRRQ